MTNNQQAARELLPCPFCGSSNLKLHEHPLFNYIFCDNCCACGPDVKASDAAVAWNRRPTPPDSGEK